MNKALEDTKCNISEGETLESATFYIYVHVPRNYPIPNGQIVNLQRITSPWKESIVTWKNFAAAYATAVERSFRADALGWHSVDVTAIVKSWLDGSNENHGFLLDQVALTHPRVRYASKDGG